MRRIKIYSMPIVVGVLTAGVSAATEAPRVPPTTVIHAGWLLATPGSAPLHEQTIVIRAGVVQSVSPGYQPPPVQGPDAKVIELRDRYVLPGLMDLHVHLSQDVTIPQNQWKERLARPAATLAFEAARGAEHMLQSGFTTVRDVGGAVNVVFPLRDAIAQGLIPGPRVLAAGPIISRTGGHGGETPCDGVESCRRVTRQRIGVEGADVIKIASGGGGGDATSAGGGAADMFPDEIEAVTQSAAQLNRYVAAHAHSTAAINAALRGGVRTIEHGTHFDDTSVKLFKEKGAFLVPTVYVVDFLDNDRIRNGMSPDRWENLSAALKETRAVPGRAYRAGVRMALGTDSGNELTANPAREMQLYVESGVPAGEAIKAATVNAAEAIGQAQHLGQIKPGMTADVIAVDADPLEDISRLFPNHINLIMKEGHIYRLTAGDVQ